MGKVDNRHLKKLLKSKVKGYPKPEFKRSVKLECKGTLEIEKKRKFGNQNVKEPLTSTIKGKLTHRNLKESFKSKLKGTFKIEH